LNPEGLAADPARRAIEWGLIGQHHPMAIQLVGAWRWELLHKHLETVLPLVKQPYVIDFGGADGPIGYGAIIVDVKAPIKSLYDVKGWPTTVVACHVLEHIEDVRLVLNCIWHKLQWGGHLVAMVPSWRHMAVRADHWPYHAHSFRFDKHEDAPQHYDRLDTLVGSTGFAVKLMDEDGTNLLVIAQKEAEGGSV
jgi:hypothetical protein